MLKDYVRNIKTAEVVIDVSETSVRLVKTNAAGRLLRTGVAALPARMEPEGSEAYITALAAVIKEAKKAARASSISRCVLVTGGPHVIIQRFVWPEMPADALQLNAVNEIAPYLPEEEARFSINYKVISEITHHTDTGTPVKQFNIMVTAVARDVVSALLTASRKAGLYPNRVDIRENARGKLAGAALLWDKGDEETPFDPAASFAVLDLAAVPYNLSVYIDGAFYANRYFGTTVDIPDTHEPDAAQLAAEITSIVDYIQYKERGTQINALLLFADIKEYPNLPGDLGAGLDMPVIGVAASLNPRLVSAERLKEDASCYLDAYGASIRRPHDLDIKPPRVKKHYFRRFILPVLCVVLLLGGAAGGITLYLSAQIQTLRERYAALDTPPLHEITQADIAALDARREAAEAALADIHDFQTRFPAAVDVIIAIYSAMPPGTTILTMDISSGEVAFTAALRGLDPVADWLDALRLDPLVDYVTAQTAVLTYTRIYIDEEEYEMWPVVHFVLTLALHYGT